MANGSFGGGKGTEESPYLVEDILDLDAIRNDLTAHYKQTKDINFQYEENFAPIGGTNNEKFSGSYDGNGKKIKNFIQKRSQYNNGLFGEAENANFKNITITNVNMTIYDYSGAICGELDGGSFDNCHVTGTLNPIQDGVYKVGGLAGYVEKSTITNCSAKVTVGGEGQLGGLVGCMSDCFVYNSFSESTVNCTTGYGGQTGVFTGALWADSVDTALIENCYSNGYASGQTDVGGFVGETDGTIRNCYALGTVDGANPNNYSYNYDLGGFCGSTYGKLENCVASVEMVNMPTDKSRVGGFLGRINQSQRDESIVGSVHDCYYNADIAGLSDTGKGEPKTTAELADPTTYENWDFETVWTITEKGKFELVVFAPAPEPGPVEINIDFSKTKLLRDALGSAIPQVWHTDLGKWVPITPNLLGGGGSSVGTGEIATTDELGLVRIDGRTIISDEDGVITAVIPIATAKLLGGIKPDGETILVDAQTGVASVPQKVHTSTKNPTSSEGNNGDIWYKFTEVD